MIFYKQKVYCSGFEDGIDYVIRLFSAESRNEKIKKELEYHRGKIERGEATVEQIMADPEVQQRLNYAKRKGLVGDDYFTSAKPIQKPIQQPIQQQPGVTSTTTTNTGNKPPVNTGNKPPVNTGNKPPVNTGNKPPVNTGNKPQPHVNTGNKPFLSRNAKIGLGVAGGLAAIGGITYGLTRNNKNNNSQTSY
jgi:hypothetical protein